MPQVLTQQAYQEICDLSSFILMYYSYNNLTHFFLLLVGMVRGGSIWSQNKWRGRLMIGWKCCILTSSALKMHCTLITRTWPWSPNSSPTTHEADILKQIIIHKCFDGIYDLTVHILSLLGHKWWFIFVMFCDYYYYLKKMVYFCFQLLFRRMG